MLRPYFPSWMKDERAEFTLELLSALTLLFAVIWWLT
jgi:hypothetical protein